MKARFLFAPVPIFLASALIAVDFWFGVHWGVFSLICLVSAGSVFEACRAFESSNFRVPYWLCTVCSLVWMTLAGILFLVPEKMSNLFRLSLEGGGGILLAYGMFAVPLLAILAIIIIYGLRNCSPATVRGGLGGLGLVVLFNSIYIQSFVLIHLFPDRPDLSTLWIVFIVLVNKGSDTAAYLIGKGIGVHQMTPRLSPNKTWEGLAGAVCAGGLMTVPFALYSELGVHHSIPLMLGAGVALSLSGAVGDLVGSMLKRGAEVEDSSVLIPELGGILDMSDCFLVSVPVSLLILLLIT